MQNFKIQQLALAVAGAFLSGAVLAGTQIPLTLEDAQRTAEADRQSSIAVGARTVQANGSSTTDFQAWNGSVEQKSSLDVDLNVQGGDAAQGWAMTGQDIGTEIPELGLEYHRAGVFDAEAGYKRFRHVSNADARFVDAGSDPKGQLLDTGVLEQVRDVYHLGARWMPTDRTEVRAVYQLDDRDGSQSVLSNAAKRAFAAPVDDRHHQFDASGEWTYENFSLEATYYLSKYENNNFKVVRTHNGTSYGLARDPSNTLHQVGLDGLWQISDTSTLSVSAGYAWSKLDDDAFGAASKPLAYSFDAETKIPTFDVAYTARPIQDLSVSAKYGYRKVDNSVDDNNYDGDYYFHDQSYTQHKLSADAIYSLGKGYAVKGWASMVDKSYESVIEGNTEWKGGLELRKRMSSTLSGKLSYQYTNRTAEDWRAYGKTIPGKNEGTWFPWSYAAFEEHAVRFDLYTSPIDTVTLGFNGSVYTRDYDKDGAKSTAVGVTSSDGYRFGINADWVLNRDLSLFGFYAYDRQSFDRYATSNTSDETDQTHTFGLGFDLHPELRPWSLKMQYVYCIDKSDVGYYSASSNDAEYKSHYAETSGTWRLNESWSLQGSALYGKVDSDDFMRSGVISSVGTDSRLSANYSAALFYLGVKYDLPI